MLNLFPDGITILPYAYFEFNNILKYLHKEMMVQNIQICKDKHF